MDGTFEDTYVTGWIKRGPSGVIGGATDRIVLKQ